MNWNGKSDIWSLGCILLELMTGRLLFEPNNDGEHLAMMQRACGENSLHEMLWRCRRADVKRTYLREKQDGYWRLQTAYAEANNAIHQKSLQRMLRHEHADFADLCIQMLDPNPRTRPSAADLLRHRAFRTVPWGESMTQGHAGNPA